MQTISSKKSLISASYKQVEALTEFNPTNEALDDLFEETDKNVIQYCWRIKLNAQFKRTPKPLTVPRLKQIISFLPATIRMIRYWLSCKRKNVDCFVDFFSPLKCKQIFGAPIGGIGAGSIGRTFTGEFARYQIMPGLYEHDIVESNLFTVCIRKKFKTVYQQALTTKRPKLKGLRSWNMAYSGDQATYYALYPESWIVYNLPGQHVTLTCHQITPIIPNNYKDSSLPVGLFSWQVNNNNNEDIELSLMFTWQSGSSSDKFQLTDVSSKSFKNYSNFETKISGATISQKLQDIPLEYCIAAQQNDNCQITYNCQFYADNEESGRKLWMDLLDDGQLDNIEYSKNKIPIKPSSKLSVAVCVKVTVKAMSKENIQFALVWNMPTMKFNGMVDKTLKRFYTKYFPVENLNAAMDISSYSFSQRNAWIKKIREWQKPILQNNLFNELYFVADGGTIWINEENNDSLAIYKEYGRFAYLEGHEYKMYNTYDVHFYASFALLKLWPKLQLSIQYEFCDTIKKVSHKPIKFLLTGETGVCKKYNTIPHDLGQPDDLPLQNLNAYILHDTNDWKDLNLKFILQCYRDYYHLKDIDYLKYVWPHIKSLMVTIQSQDHDNDGLIDSQGKPDQTYDAWFVYGASAYCGGLHVASLKCVCEIAKILDDAETLEKYNLILQQAKNSYDTKLWNGKYYKYDCSNSNYNDSIMTDMCCGHWYLRSSGFKHEVFEQEKIRSCLETIFEYNVMKYGDAKMGSVNGMRPNGNVDITSLQSEEMWIGVTNALASLMIYENMNDKAWKTLEGMYDMLYNQLGLAFQTPEALVNQSIYRSLGYMRPLCIWSIPFAIESS